jgi:hypothetical protein
MKAEGPVDCGSGAFVSEEIVGEGEQGFRDITTVNV